MPEAWRLLIAFDFGLKRIGVATANRHTRTASPLTTLTAETNPPWTKIDALVAEWQPDLIVIGEPGPGADPALTAALREFAAGLKARYALPVETVDESFTSTAAEDRLRAARREGNYNHRLKRGLVDRHAACLIAEQWMNQELD